jgi:hypothetical protein
MGRGGGGIAHGGGLFKKENGTSADAVQDSQNPNPVILPSPSGLNQARHSPVSMGLGVRCPVDRGTSSVDLYQSPSSIALINPFHCINLLGGQTV